MAIKAIIFDMDGVLIDSLESNIMFFQKLMQKAGYKKPSRKILKENFHLTMKDMIRTLTKASEDEVTRVWKIGKNSRYREFAKIPTGKIPDGSKNVIDMLSHKYRMGIVTGRIKIGVQEVFRLSRNRRLFSAIVSFEDYAKPKPDTEPLLVALKRLKVKPEEAVYIGDAETDMLAAKAAGMHFILYSKKRVKGADLCVRSFSQIPEAILKIENAEGNK